MEKSSIFCNEINMISLSFSLYFSSQKNHKVQTSSRCMCFLKIGFDADVFKDRTFYLTVHIL